MQHQLKSWPEWFEAVHSGVKTFEVRVNDRGFAVGDRLWLREWNPESETYTGREVVRWVTYILDSEADIIPRGIEPGYVVMALGDVADGPPSP